MIVAFSVFLCVGRVLIAVVVCFACACVVASVVVGLCVAVLLS